MGLRSHVSLRAIHNPKLRTDGQEMRFGNARDLSKNFILLRVMSKIQSIFAAYLIRMAMTKAIIKDGNPQAKMFVAYACKSAVVKSYAPALSSHVAKNFVSPKLSRHKQDIQNTHLEDWTETTDKQFVIRYSTQSAGKRISTGKYAYLSVVCKRTTARWKRTRNQNVRSEQPDKELEFNRFVNKIRVQK